MTDFSLHKTRSLAPRLSIFGWLMAAHDVWRSRRQLASLDHDRLEDIGLTRRSAEKEANRPIWDVPAHWLK